MSDGDLKNYLIDCASAPPGYEADWQRFGLHDYVPPYDAGTDASIDFKPGLSGLDASATAAGSDASARDVGMDAASEPKSTPEGGSGCALATSGGGAAWLLALFMLVPRKRS